MSMELWWNDTDRGNWSIGREILFSVCGRWMNECGVLVEWYWQGKTEVLGENTVLVRLLSPQIPHKLTLVPNYTKFQLRLCRVIYGIYLITIISFLEKQVDYFSWLLATLKKDFLSKWKAPIQVQTLVHEGTPVHYNHICLSGILLTCSKGDLDEFSVIMKYIRARVTLWATRPPVVMSTLQVSFKIISVRVTWEVFLTDKPIGHKLINCLILLIKRPSTEQPAHKLASQQIKWPSTQ
jgi:hypothetical protein